MRLPPQYLNAWLAGLLVLASVVGQAVTTVIEGPVGPAFSCVQGTIPTNFWAAYSVTRLLNCSYTGPAIRVQRTSDSTQSDIGFVNGLLDTNTLVSFTGAGSAYLTTLYDQSGHGSYITNGPSGFSTNNNPRIVTDGTLLVDSNNRPWAYAHATTVEMNGLVSSQLGTSSGGKATCFNVVNMTTNAIGELAELGTPGGIKQVSSSGARVAVQNNGTDVVGSPAYSVNTTYLLTWHLSNGLDDYIQLNNNVSAGGDAGTQISFGPEAIGKSSPGTSIHYFQEFLVWPGTLSRSHVEIVQSNIFAFYGISKQASALNSNLVSYWKLDETSSTRVDSESTGTAQDLTDNNTVTSNTGKLGNAAQFTLANSESLTRADSADNSTGNIDYAWTFWVYLDTEATYQGMISKSGGSPNNEFFIRYNQPNDRIEFYESYNGTSYSSVVADSYGAVTTATWYFVFAAHDAANDRLFISINNGIPTTAAANSAGTFDSTAALAFGKIEVGSYLNGRLDEVSFHKRMLTSDELTLLYGNGTPPGCCPFP